MQRLIFSDARVCDRKAQAPLYQSTVQGHILSKARYLDTSVLQSDPDSADNVPMT